LSSSTVFQTVGGAFSTAIAQSVFLNRLLAALPNTAPSVDPKMVILTGAAKLHEVFPPDVLPGVLEAYMTGLKGAFLVAVAFCGVAFLCSLTIPMGKLPTHGKGAAPMAMA
jgi:hypothetical protein